MGGRAKGSSEDQYSFHLRVYTAARMSNLRQTPLTCSGHTRPVVFLAFSEINSDGIYYSISACKDGKPMLRQGDVLTVATGSKVIFYEAGTFEKMKEVSVSCPVYSASLNKAQDIFVCGGEDLKLYKFDYQTGIEIDNFKGHF